MIGREAMFLSLALSLVCKAAAAAYAKLTQRRFSSE